MATTGRRKHGRHSHSPLQSYKPAMLWTTQQDPYPQSLEWESFAESASVGQARRHHQSRRHTRLRRRHVSWEVLLSPSEDLNDKNIERELNRIGKAQGHMPASSCWSAVYIRHSVPRAAISALLTGTASIAEPRGVTAAACIAFCCQDIDNDFQCSISDWYSITSSILSFNRSEMSTYLTHSPVNAHVGCTNKARTPPESG